MGVGSHRHSALFFLFLFFSSGSGVPKNPPLEAIQQNKIQVNDENHILFSSAVSTAQHDTIPVVNPSPTVTTPTLVFPASPPPPATVTTPTTPITTPTSPTITPTTPYITPTTPYITPTTPYITPTTPTITPTTPTTTPTTPTTTPTTPTTTPASSGGTWCIASQSASETALQVALDYACGYGGADCSPVQPSGSCYNPNTLRDHASYAFNDYYQKNPAPTSCSFGGTAQLTTTDPSSGSCHYPSSATSTSMTPPSPTMSTPIITTTPPSPTTPTIATPSGSSIYGEEPSESPNAANSISSCMLLLSTTLLGSLLAAIYL
uniref:carbohydrate-binding X8 domain-containing protein-like n=1 Tax=Fragaria vesca subsp. vesca TaxID=101020 RepID=UPI0005CADFC4|nr:PREDICTED: carbohydrate-binding X8 domain-containing protein-like [Fragaria vesca subsp. vesca]